MSSVVFSIIIPTYQSEQTIRACIESILQQSFKDFEVIVHDGLSTDRTCDLVSSFMDPRIRLFSEKDQGVYDAMNRAIGKLNGRWVLFLGSDDRLYAPDTLAVLKTLLDDVPAPDLVYGNVQAAGDSHWIKDGAIYMGQTDLTILFEKNLCHQSILYNRRIFASDERYSLKYPVLADFDFNLRCFARYRTLYTPQVIAFYATGGLSSTTADEAFAQDKWINIIRYFRYRLLTPSFAPHKQPLKRAAKHILKKRIYHVTDRLAAVTVYLYFKFLK